MRKSNYCLFSIVVISLLLLNIVQYNNQNSFSNKSSNEICINNTNINSEKHLKTAGVELPTEIWNKTWGVVYSETSNEIAVDSEDNIYNTGSFGFVPFQISNISLNKISSDGFSFWNRTINTNDYDESWGISVDSDNNIFITGFINYTGVNGTEVFTAKYNKSGVLEWFKTWGGPGYDWGRDIAVDSQGNVYVVGDTESYGVKNSSVLILKYDSAGNFKWNQTWDSYKYEFGYGIDIDKNTNELYITGEQSYFNSFDAILLKYNSTGHIKWKKSFINATGSAVKVDLEGNIYITGYRYLGDAFLAKFNNQSDQLWNSSCYLAVRGNDLAVDSNNNLYVVGDIGGDVWIGIYHSNGFMLWNMTWGKNKYDKGHGIALDSKDNIYVTGNLDGEGMGDGAEQFILKLSAYKPPSPNISIISPNPGIYGPSWLLINASITDAYSTISSAKALINATIPFNISMTRGIGDYWSCTWNNMSSYASGHYMIRIWAINSAGIVNQTVFNIITIERDQPQIMVLVSAYNTKSLYINASIWDAISVKVLINATTPFNISMTQGLGNSWSCYWDNISSYTSGHYMIRIWAIDDKSNVNQNVFFVFILDNDKVTILSLGDGDSDDKDDDDSKKENELLNLILLLIILSTLGVATTSTYIIKTKRSKKKQGLRDLKQERSRLSKQISPYPTLDNKLQKGKDYRLETTESIEKPQKETIDINIKLEDLLNIELENNVLKKFLAFNDINITALSENFMKKVEQLNWDEGEKDIFIREMLSLTPSERNDFIADMLNSSKIDYSEVIDD